MYTCPLTPIHTISMPAIQFTNPSFSLRQPIIRFCMLSNFLIQTLEPTSLALEQLVRATVFYQLAFVHDDDFVEVEDGVEFVGDGYEGVVWEFGAQEALDVGVCCCVETMQC
jgi:hypothetical protein